MNCFYIKIAAVILVLSSIVYSQSISFEKYWSSSGSEYGYCIRQTIDGGYVVTGDTYTNPSNNLDIFLMKLDESGNQIWFKTFGTSNVEESKAVFQTKDGGYILTGWTGTYSNYKLILIKTDSNGNEVWKKVWASKSLSDGLDVKQTKDGGYIICAEGVNGNNFDGWIIKTDKDGNEEWNKFFGGDKREIFFNLQLTSDDGFIFLGYSMSYTSNGSRDYYLVKTDSQGNEEWSKTYDGIGGHDWGRRIRITPDGGYIFTGASKNPSGFAQMLLIKINSQGAEEWRKQYGDNISAQGRGLDLTSDGGYIISGKCNPYNSGNTNGWLIKTDANGNKIWDKQFGTSNDEADLEYVQQTKDGGYICTGFSSTSNSQSDLIIIKTDPLGYVGIDDNLNQDTELFNYSLKQNYPNPFNPSTTINFEINKSSEVCIRVIDTLGRIIKVLVREKLSEGEYTINWNGTGENGNSVGSGIYFCELFCEDSKQVIKMNLIK